MATVHSVNSNFPSTNTAALLAYILYMNALFGILYTLWSVPTLGVISSRNYLCFAIYFDCGPHLLFCCGPRL